MDIIKEIKKQANNIMKNEKTKEQFGNTIENGLKSIKDKVKDKDKKDLLDKAIKAVDKVTTAKKKTANKKVEKKETKKKNTAKPKTKTTNKSTKKTTTKPKTKTTSKVVKKNTKKTTKSTAKKSK